MGGHGFYALGDLKFKCDPWPGREAAGREGPRAQEARAFKGPVPPAWEATLALGEVLPHLVLLGEGRF